VSPTPPDPKPIADRHLWQIAAVRDIGIVLAVALLLVAVVALRALLAPIVLAFALAYIVDPLVRLAQHRLRIPRIVTSLALLLVVGGLLVTLALWLVPILLGQLETLRDRLPDYGAAITAWIGGLLSIDQPTATQLTRVATRSAEASGADAQQIADTLVTGVGRLFGFVGTVVSTAIYLVVATILLLIFFVSFVAGFDRLDALKRLLPASRRERIWELLGKVNVAFSAYVRGQFIVALFTTTGFAIGFAIVGVPYWFVISLIGGTLSLIPYGQMSGWLLAIAAKLVDAQMGTEALDWVAVLVLPSMVYAVTQSMESWVITPWVQGEAVDLHPVTVIVVLLVGGTLAGIVGLILAIPLTASARMLYEELFRERAERWLAEH
jgi:predicted PurR-regulated permease PerM